MCGIVTLLGDPYKSQVEALWHELEAECGLYRDELTTTPHFSWQVTEGYDFERLKPVLEELVSEMFPFKARAKGLGLFSGEKPVLYIPLVKDLHLLHFHEEIWKRVSKTGVGISPYYASTNWIPHITLAHDSLDHDKLSLVMDRLASRPFNWEFLVDNIAYICLQQNREEEIRFLFQGSGVTEYQLLPLPEDSRSALVVVDMQNYFFRKPERRQGLKEVIRNINQLIDYFDANNLPVFHAITSFQADQSDWDLKMKMNGIRVLINGEVDTQIVPQIRLSEKHIILPKTRYSAFFKTNLASYLNEENVHRVVVVGAYTHYCINATIFEAYAHDFVPCLITDAVISHLNEESELMINRMRRNGYHLLSTSGFLNG